MVPDLWITDQMSDFIYFLAIQILKMWNEMAVESDYQANIPWLEGCDNAAYTKTL